jgi:hypothetical protein
MAVIVLDTFNGTDGSSPSGALIMDAAGDLFGMTTDGGADGLGEVFEIADTNGSYASTPTVVFSAYNPGYPEDAAAPDNP